MVLKLIFLIAIIVFENFVCYGNEYDGYTVYEVPLLPVKITEENLKKSLNYPSTAGDIEVIHRNPFNGSVHVLVSPSKKHEFLSTLRRKKLKSKVIIQDVGRLIRPRLQLRMENVDVNIDDVIDYYMTFEQIREFIEKMSQKFPQKIRTKSIGSTFEGVDIPMVIITEQIQQNQNKPIIFLESGIHAREWISVSIAIYFIQELARTTTYTKDVEWRIIPVANPDGYKFTFTKKRMWRKNRRKFPRSRCMGTDLNRNFDFHWNSPGSDTKQCSDEYIGEAPFSEPESRAIRDAIMEVQNRIKVFVSFHNYGQYIFHPPSILAQQIPEERRQILENLGNQMGEAIYEEYSVRYKVGTAATLMYEASGSSMDWSFFIAGVPIAFTFELRDEGQYGFLLPEEQILLTGDEIWAALKVLYVETKKLGMLTMLANLNIDARQDSISDDGLNLETSSRRSIDPKHASISDDGVHPETNAANEISIPFRFVHSVLTNLLNDWLSYLWNNDVNKLLDNFFIGNDVD